MTYGPWRNPAADQDGPDLVLDAGVISNPLAAPPRLPELKFTSARRGREERRASASAELCTGRGGGEAWAGQRSSGQFERNGAPRSSACAPVMSDAPPALQLAMGGREGTPLSGSGPQTCVPCAPRTWHPVEAGQGEMLV